MHKNLILGFVAILWAGTFLRCGQTSHTIPATVDFNDHIRPILSDRCFACHGPDENTREADLSLHTPEGAFAALDGDDHFVIKPGDAKRSELYLRIDSDEGDYQMPPPSSNLTVSPYEKSLIKKWIEQGANWENHWSFIPPEKPHVPSARNWATTPIDQFILRKMQSMKLDPNPEAPREKLIRRVYFDLTGLPPSNEAIQEFVHDTDENAYEKVVDQALASAAYGERMAVTWLDVARYADSHGYQDDRQRTMWPWRDWVIDAFNNNMPYDQFVTYQLAGDLLPNATYEQKLATGFNRNHAITQEGGVINEEYLTEYAADRTDVFATGFLGLTMQCARCHDHKYDPITQEDFYQTFAFFNNVKDERGQISYFDLAPTPSMAEENPQREEEIERIKETIANLEDQLTEMSDPDLFQTWKKDFNPVQAWDLTRDFVAKFNLNESEGWSFQEQNKQLPPAHVNLNLPPSIDRPERVDGIEGGALKFNGSNFLSLGDVGDFDHHHPFSLGAWVKYDQNLDRNAGLLAKRNGELAREGYDLFLQPNGMIGFRMVGERRLGNMEVVTRAKIPKREWKHIMLTYDGSGKARGVSIFINGQPQNLRINVDTLHRSSILNGNDFLVGNWNHRARKSQERWGFAGGSIDQPMIFNRRLSALEIKSIYHNGVPQAASEADLKDFYRLNISAKHREIRSQLFDLRAQDLTIPSVMIMGERDTIKPTFVLARGAYDAPGKPVNRSTPESILPFSPELPQNRLGLAQWLFDAENPLTARVYVNRLWQMCFGRGIVSTPEDFGSQGKLPTHPQLLDYLATEFMASGWDIKHLLKTIVMSATYRQSVDASPQQRLKDPDNIWLSRGPHQTLTAEMLRDQALTVSGLLNPKIGGKWVKFYQPPGIWKALANQIGENKYRPSRGEDLYRRSLYNYWKRTIPPPTLLTLDAPERSVCTVKRQATSTPLQALILLNDPTYVEAARALSERVLKTNPQDIKEGIDHIFERFTSRRPNTTEIEQLSGLYDQIKLDFESGLNNLDDWLQVGATPPDTSLPPIELAALTAVSCTILNLDEAKHR